MANIVTIQCDALPAATSVVSVRGRELISMPYRFEVGLRIDDPAFEMDGAIRARATLSIDRGPDGAPYPIHGVLCSLELLSEWEGKALYRALLVPKLWSLGLSRHSRIFTDNSVPEIIEAVLKFGGLTTAEFELRLQKSYPKREHVFQYRESNLAFISRWMERLGMYYFFEHGEGSEKLVITDNRSAHHALRQVPVRYVPLSGDDAMADEAFDAFHCVRSALPAWVMLADYDYINPTLAVAGSAQVALDGIEEVHRHDHNFVTPDEGTALAAVRAEALLAEQKVFLGRGRAFYLRSGHTFTLDEHPRATFNREYLVVELEHLVNQGASDAKTKQLLGLDEEQFGTDEYGVRVKAIGADVQYRAPERHPWPRIDGFEGATVCGDAASEYAQIDKHGRYKVRLRCDESDLIDGSASTWVRMLQPHGGTNEGFHFPLRKGTEVVLIFLGGDPDQPVLAGVVPNAHRPSPVTAGNHTYNVIQTGGLNRMELNDASGAQHIKLTTPTENTHIHMGAPNDEHNLHVCTDGDTITHSGRNWDCFTYGAKYEYVKLDSDLNIDGNEFITVKGIRCENVQQHVSSNYDMDYVLTVLGMHDVQVTQTRTDHVQGDVTETYDSKHELTVGGDQKITVGGKLTEEVKGGNYDLTVSGKYNLTAANTENFWKGWQKSFTGGIWTDVIVGLKNENILGGKIETLVGLKSETLVAGRFLLAVGVKAEADWAAELKTVAAKMDTLAYHMQLVGSTIRSGAIHICQTVLKLL
ncbi:MAG: type VI secretion system tip protein VgrG [Deltaproteobacteria bacterium]|nr:type VI secretion system tip protein VgrG [Deltaproteobacteria bacterium]